MHATWIEATARGRHGGPVRAGMWSTVVLGTHPVESDQVVWLELVADDVPLGQLPGYYQENKSSNSYWHVPIPPQAVGTRLRFRAVGRGPDGRVVHGPSQEVVVRPNLPDRTEAPELAAAHPEGLVGNRMMTVRVDNRGSTYDIYFPSVGLTRNVRPAEGDRPQSRSHFRAIVGGLATGPRLDWFAERSAWEAFQHYQGATNLLVTELRSRSSNLKVVVTDLVAMGPELPRTTAGTESVGQYLKRFRIQNDGPEDRRTLFGVYVQAEINGGVGEPGLSWFDEDRCLLAINRGHQHTDRKLARDATVEFAIAMDDRGEVHCEPTGPNEAMLLRKLEIPAGGSATVDLLVSGAFTGWGSDPGTYEYWIRPALRWFRGADLDQVEPMTADQWDAFVEPLPTLHFPRTAYGVALRRSALAAALHVDAKWGSVAAGFDRGLSAYCYPRDAIFTGLAMGRVGHPEIGRSVFEWLGMVRGQIRPFTYWFHKYTMEGTPEWETPCLDQSAMIPWAIEATYRRTGDPAFLESCWPVIEQAATVCMGEAGHPGLRYLDDLALVSSAGVWDGRYGAFLYGNAAAVAGLRSAARLATLLDRAADRADSWRERADRMWEEGVLGHGPADGQAMPGLVDGPTGRFLEARRLSTLRGQWTDRPEALIERSGGLDISLLGPAVPFDLLPASDRRLRRTAEALLRGNAAGSETQALARWSPDPATPEARRGEGETRLDPSSLATLWMARYLIRLGRETGDPGPWGQAVGLLNGLFRRLCPLGLALRARVGRGEELGSVARPLLGVWELHVMLIETLLELAGLDYEATTRTLTLRPALPPTWPHVGLGLPMPCGDVDYLLERPDGERRHRLTVRTDLRHPVRLEIDLICPDLVELGRWSSDVDDTPPRFDRERGRLTWSIDLDEGENRSVWSWGLAGVGEGLGV